MPDPNILFKNAPPTTLNESFHNALVNYADVKEMPVRQKLLEQQATAASDANAHNQLKFQLFDMASDALQLKPVLESGNIGAALQAVDRRVEKIKQRGGDPSDTLAFRKMLESGDVKGAMLQLDAPISAARQLGVLSGSGDIPAELKVFQALNKAAGSTPEQQAQAARVALGLDPRASTIKVVDIGGVPTVVDSNANTATPISIGGREISVGDIAGNRAQIAAAESGASEGAKLEQQQQFAPAIAGEVAASESKAKLEAELKLQPEIEKAIKDVVNNAGIQADQLKEARSNAAALNVYETAMNGLKSAMSETTTGPIVGRSPAFTVKQQIASGAVSAMAPVLKQIFRSAGEGSFTEKDQELLLEMVPTRKDNQEAIEAKIKNIDAIVRAKLRAPSQPQIPEGQTATNPQTGQKIIFRGGRWVPM